MKKFLLGLIAASFVLLLAGCDRTWSNEDIGTATGATAGGVLGGLLFHGDAKIPGIIGGAVIGGILGNRIGNRMDYQDRVNMNHAIVNTPQGQTATWTNQQTHTTYQVTPTRTYQSHDQYCREFQTKVTIDGKQQDAYGRACRKPDGSWEVVKQ